MHYVYVLRSLKDSKFYIGYTENLERRLNEHNDGKVTSTKHRSPFELVYYEACKNQKDALRRERYLKTTYGKRYIKNRIRDALNV
jgi:putative endonuclease